MNISFKELCIARYTVQIRESAYTAETIASTLQTCWWISTDESLHARTQTVRYPLQHIESQIIETRIHGKKRILTRQIFLLLYPQLQEKFAMQHQQLEFMKGETCQSLDNIKLLLPQSTNKLLKQYIDKWQLVITYKNRKKQYCIAAELYQNENTEYNIQSVILKALTAYPYLSLAELEYLTFLPQNKLGRPIYELEQRGRIIRNIQLENDSTERFCIADEQVSRNVTDSMLLGTADPLIELLVHAKLISTKGVTHIFFIKGVPQASMKIKQKTLQNFTLLKFAMYAQDVVIHALQEWNTKHKHNLIINLQTAIYATTAHTFTKQLFARGYNISAEGAQLIRKNMKGRKQQIRQFSLKVATDWLLNHQIKTCKDVDTIFTKNLQVESIDSFICRLQQIPDLNKRYVYGAGINKRVGYISAKIYIDCNSLYTTNHKLNFKEQRVLTLIQQQRMHTSEFINIPEIEKILRSLESNYLIIRVNFAPTIADAEWGLAPQVTIKRELSTLYKEFLLLLLKHQMPLTKQQLLSYLGWHLPVLNETLDSLINSKEIVEGYFINHITDLQYTTEATLVAIQQHSLIDTNIYIIPSTDPIGRLYFASLLSMAPEVQPSKAYPPTAEIFLLYYAAELIGYCIKIPKTFVHNDGSIIDYTIELIIRQSHHKGSILANIVEHVANYFLVFHQERGQIVSINNTPIQHYENLKFTIELVGLKI